MNKSVFLNELVNATHYSKEECLIINEVLEQRFINGKKNKEKIIDDFKAKLKITLDELKGFMKHQ